MYATLDRVTLLDRATGAETVSFVRDGTSWTVAR
jgi:hypothetical protein